MADNRGKIFEREFRQGLLLLGGMAIRLFDGMSYAKQRQPADFIYAAQNRKNYLIECKSTKQNHSHTRISNNTSSMTCVFGITAQPD